MPAIRPHLGRALLMLPLGCGLAVGAAFAAAATEPAAAPPPQRVEITGSAREDDGRDATAARFIVSRDEIARHGDSSVVDVLRRVPGITVTGSQGRAPEIRMRGLGSGYTQVLINGETMPGGFSLESLSPAQIERIEIARVATVDNAAQAIAGTINIVLRQSTRKPQREMKAAVSARAGRGSAQWDSQVADRLDLLAYSLGVGLSRRNETWPATTTQAGTDAAGQPDLARQTRRNAEGLAETLSLTPKLSMAWGERTRLSMDAVLRHNRFDDHSDDLRITALGPLPRYASDTQTLDLKTTLAQVRLNGTHTLAGGGTAEVRLGSNHLRRASDTLLLGQDEQARLAMSERVTSSTSEAGQLATGKLRLPYTAGHAVALGWDADRTVRDETRTQRQSSPIGRPVTDLDERYRTQVDRLALFAQDEWDLSDRLSAYAGLRWARLRTATEGQGLAAVGSRSSVLSPVLQVLWKPVAWPGDQFRLALSRTYKAPRAVDLIPRRFVAIENTPTTPNLQGNPQLRPELAWGLDVAYEHTLPGKLGAVNLNASSRRIRDVILDRLFLENGAWVSTKADAGSARVLGLEIETRLNLRAAWPTGPDVDLRAGLARNRSAVAAIPGPDNRLDSQVPMTASLGLDWRSAAMPLSAGFNLAWRGALRARTSLTQSTATNAQSTLDLYALWKLTPQAQLRLAIANALSPHDITTDSYGDVNGRFTQTTDAPGAPTVRLGLELKL